MSAAASKILTDSIYLYDMPSAQRHSLCEILDKFNIWPDLAVLQMGYDRNILQDIKRAAQNGTSPSDELITLWGNLNHTVTELFVLLWRMQQYTAMDSIRDLVDVRYHRLIHSGQPDLSNLMNKGSTQNSTTEKKNLNSSGWRNNNLNNKINNNNINNNNNNDKIKGIEILSDENNETKPPPNISGPLDIKRVNEYASTIPQIDYSDLLEATRNWNEKNILGKGGFGTVFHGIWKCTAVAIKRIEYKGGNSIEMNKIQMQQSLNELRFLNSCRHDNILPLYGYSVNGGEPCLVYQLMTGGSLEQRINGNTHDPPLTWKQRLNIAQGTARGLQYLHTFKEKPLIHGDIKPANILLDPCNQPKIGDFGLAREGPNNLNSSMEVSRVYGTKPYLPIEFLGYKSLSTKVDTFSFGVVLFEVVTGLRAYDKNRQYKFLTKHIQMVCADNTAIDDLMDKATPIEKDSQRMCETMIKLGLICVSDKPEQRPEMVIVLRRLEALLF